MVYIVYCTTKGPQLTTSRRIKQTPGLPRTLKHPSPSGTAAQPPPLPAPQRRNRSNSRQQHPGIPALPLPGETGAPPYPSRESSPSTADPSIRHCASVVSGSFFCKERAAFPPRRRRQPGSLRALPKPHRALVGVHALLALQTCRQLLVGAVGDLLHQLQALLHLRMRPCPSPGRPAWSRTRREGTEGTCCFSTSDFDCCCVGYDSPGAQTLPRAGMC